MSKREKRVISAFINCVRSGEYTFDYAVILLEDETKYGWLSDEAKNQFYEEFEPENPGDEEDPEGTGDEAE